MNYYVDLSAVNTDIIIYRINFFRFAFQVIGTLVVFVILWVLLAKLPKSGSNGTLITAVNCSGDDASQLNSGDTKPFWVS